MVYSKQTWADGTGGGTPVSAARLNTMESGIESVSGKNWLPSVWCLPGVNLNAVVNNEATSAGLLYMVPFFINCEGRVTDVAINVGTAAGAGNNARLGIYSKDASGDAWTLVNDIGTVAIDSIGDKIVSTLTIDLLRSGIYGVAVLCQAACSLTSKASDFPLQGSDTTPFSGYVHTFLGTNQAYGALPSSITPTPQGGWSQAFNRAMIKMA